MKLIKFGIAAACIAPMFAYADAPKLYGKVHVSAGYQSTEADGADDVTRFAVTSHSSRIGIKGSEKLDGGMKAIYKLEFQIDTTDTSNSKDGHIKSRDQYVGVEKGVHTIRLGRLSNPHKKNMDKVDPLSDSALDYNNIIQKDPRVGNTLMYNADWDMGVSFALAYSAGDDAENDNNNGENEGDAISASIGYKAENFQVGYSFNIQESSEDADESEVAMKIGGKYDLGSVDFGLVFENVSPANDSDDDITEIYASANFDVNDMNKLSVVYGQRDTGDDDETARMYGLIAKHKYSKRTSAYALLGQGTDGGLDNKAKLDDDSTVLALGMIHKF